ncbi:GGDEF domain-containing protein [Celerinatantimonas sp. MCCC 1A17872]|uniref:GGDEF domain-containing protein n=1 Tax=Celerinatantimonas sp. MCCC 1A17872 TaxID=3177514 RepID=UPI0038C2CCB3
MLHIDISTLLIMDIVLGIVSSLVLTLLLRSTEQCPGVMLWVLGHWCVSIGLLFLFARFWIPMPVSVLLGNSIVSLSIAFYTFGFYRYHSLNIRKLSLAIFSFPVITFIAIGIALLEHATFTQRVILVDILMMAQISITIYLCFMRLEKFESARKFWAILLSMMFVGVIIRTILNLLTSHTQFLQTYNWSNVLMVILETTYLFAAAIFIPVIAAQKLQNQLLQYANHDEVTGLYNRHAMYKYADLTMTSVQHIHGHHAFLALIDIDHFKKVNDQYGHLIGDKVLRLIAGLIDSITRERDLVARFGGEEFLVLLPDQTPEQALTWANRTLKTISEHPIVVEDQHLFVTVSIGLAQLSEPIRTFDALIEKADCALYQAKDEGRNCVRLYQATS